ncbi:hypothetical protein FRC00_000357 [Tulasnella sp. 408]|nr:hypothetical protein FRC00_000357 [Tulasnella sp. 408]
MAHPRSAYTGSESILVIAIDVGTTYSGASYTILTPDHVPQIFDVKGYEGQEDRQGNTKVPSVLIYSHEGNLLACGAEIARVKPHEGIRTEWFKLELQPPSMKVDGRPKVNLPPGRTATDVFGDFLKYMYNCVRKHIVESQFNGSQLWSSLKGTAHFVLRQELFSLFPGQQNDMRQAAIRGGLVPDTPEGHDRIEFVTEGEASLHWCTDQGMTGVDIKAILNPPKEGTNVVVADLGGGTIDVSSFVVTTPKPLCLRERRSPECAIAGSITVTSRFMEAMTPRLLNSPYGDSEDDYIHVLQDEFDQKTKCIFNEKTDSEVYIRIGRKTDNFVAENGAFRIEFGLLEVQRYEFLPSTKARAFMNDFLRQDIVDAFEPSIAATVNAIRAHLTGTSDAVRSQPSPSARGSRFLLTSES